MQSKRYIKAIYSILMAMVFMSPQLLNPLHMVFMHHHDKPIVHNKTATLSADEIHCAYCDFHFFHFINETGIEYNTPYILHNFKKEAGVNIQSTFSNNFYGSNSGRAPPVL
ncbi:hypothetical protein [Flavobacterium sp. MK4S-17]|uniref:hypothetical protein n=1 Tax=Flavobacterium sp. MK4S-17 TaxID=2543737 RepID=UPI0013580B10|nr:hypothetical protein [Flavobacterium sp. MK4S-17]